MMHGLPKAEAPKPTWAETIQLRLIEAVMALLLFWAIVQFSDRINQSERSMLPASAWFRVNEVYVPDHVWASNPPVIYDRQINEEFRGFYVVEVQQKLENGLWFSICSGSGVADYVPGEAIPNNTVDWQWYISRPCPVPPGVYRLRTSWEMKRVDWPVKGTVNLSNEFRVLPPGAATSLPTPAIDGTPGDP